MTRRYEYHDGGRDEAGLEGEAGDCATRAIAITTGLGYQNVHDMIDGTGLGAPLWHGNSLHHVSADHGAHPIIVDRVLHGELGWNYLGFWDRQRFVLRDLPMGRIVVHLASTRHVCAVIDRVIYDTWDCSEGGRATISGYWAPPPAITAAVPLRSQTPGV